MPGAFAYREALSVEWAARLTDLTTKEGTALLTAPYDIDGDGEWEFVANVGNQPHFVAIDQNGEIIWEQVHGTETGGGARFPKIADGALFFGSQPDYIIYAVELADGTLRWSTDVSATTNLEAMELTDYGLVYGGPTGVGVLDFADGSHLSGWPNTNVSANGQIVGAGDLDGDSTDEIAAGDANGVIHLLNKDGSVAWTHTSAVDHYDQLVIGDIHPTHAGRELLTVTDEDNSGTGEGDELTLFDDTGSIVTSHTPGTDSPAFAVAPFRDDYDGLQVAYGLEDGQEVGLLDGTLSPIWTLDLSAYDLGSGPFGQIMAGDIDGDGEWEFVVNTGEQTDSGVIVLDAAGEYVARIDGKGWDYDYVPWRQTGAPEGKQSPDIDGDSRDEFWARRLPANQTTGDSIIHILERTV